MFKKQLSFPLILDLCFEFLRLGFKTIQLITLFYPYWLFFKYCEFMLAEFQFATLYTCLMTLVRHLHCSLRIKNIEGTAPFTA